MNALGETVAHKKQKGCRWTTLFFLALSLASFCLIVAGIYLAIPYMEAAYQNWSEYFGLKWAHQSMLIQTLINSVLMLWLGLSSLFFGGWLLRRSIRKLRGYSWSVEVKDQTKKRFFPPVLLYLKLSCYFLVLMLLFVIFQYPLQFVFYA